MGRKNLSFALPEGLATHYLRTLLSRCTAILFLVWTDLAQAQSLEQTVAYVFNGGHVDLSEIVKVDENSVKIPGYMGTPFFFVQPAIYRVINRPTCELRVEVIPIQPQPKTEMFIYLNRVLLEETTETGPTSISLVGEDPIFCMSKNDQKNCVRKYDLYAKTAGDMSRIAKAIRHLYSKFCTSAQRKSAF